MPFAWSENAHHIQSLYRPWRPSDQCGKGEVDAAESMLGVRLPFTLRSLYQDWGHHDELLRGSDLLLPLKDMFICSNCLVICQENQAVMYWGILHANVDQDDPSVYFAETLGWDDTAAIPILGPWRLSHEHPSDFLDAFTYAHAFGNAVCAGKAREPLDERRIQILKRNWWQIDVHSAPWGLYPDAYPRHWLLWGRDYQLIWPSGEPLAAAGTEDDFDEIARELDLTWKMRWR